MSFYIKIIYIISFSNLSTFTVQIFQTLIVSINIYMRNYYSIIETHMYVQNLYNVQKTVNSYVTTKRTVVFVESVWFLFSQTLTFYDGLSAIHCWQLNDFSLLFCVTVVVTIGARVCWPPDADRWPPAISSMYPTYVTNKFDLIMASDFFLQPFRSLFSTCILICVVTVAHIFIFPFVNLCMYYFNFILFIPILHVTIVCRRAHAIITRMFYMHAVVRQSLLYAAFVAGHGIYRWSAIILF